MVAHPLSNRDSVDDTPFCHPTPLESSLIAFVFLSASFSWWIWELPSIFRHGFVEFVNRVSWQAIRVHSPSNVAILALTRRANPADWAGFYYFGAHDLPTADAITDPRRDGGWQIGWPQWVMIALYELPTLVAAILCAYRWSLLPPALRVYHSLLGTWISACLPPMVVGAVLLLTSRLAPRGQARALRSLILTVCALTFLALVIVGTAYALAIYFAPAPSDPAHRVTRPVMMIAYALVMTPLSAIPGVRRYIWLRIIAISPAIVMRAWGMLIGLGEWAWDGDRCSVLPGKMRAVTAAFCVVAFVMAILGFAVSKTVEEKRNTRKLGVGERGYSAPNLDTSSDTTGLTVVPLESRASLSVPAHARTPGYSRQPLGSSFEESASEDAPVRILSDAELRDPPPPYTASRAPTYVEET